MERERREWAAIVAVDGVVLTSKLDEDRIPILRYESKFLAVDVDRFTKFYFEP